MSAADRKVGYAVVGLGWISQVAMLPAFANAGRNSRLVALVSSGEDKRRALAERHGLTPDDTYDYDDLEACLERPDVEAVYVAVPNHLHREYTERAANMGVHVLCEKPMAVTTEECQAMNLACADAGVRLMIAYRLHFDPANLHAVRRVEDGVLGETRLFTSTFSQQVKEGDIRLVSVERGGGPLYDIGVYCINAARYLFRAEPHSVWATRVARPQERFERAEEAVSCVLRFPGDRLASFTVSLGAHAVSAFHLVGDDGHLRMEGAYDFRGERELVLRSERLEERRVYPEHDQFGPQLLHFSDCILEGREPGPDGQEGLVDVAIVRAAYESMDTGRPVNLDLVRERRPRPDQALECPALEEPDMVGASGPSGD
jgi:predicted dehydrogenase